MVLSALDDSSGWVRGTAVDVVTGYEPGSIAITARLVAMLGEDPDNTVRRKAAGALDSRHAEETAVPALVAALDDSDVYVRVPAARSLGTFGAAARSAVPRLRRCLEDPASEVREAGLYALAGISPDEGVAAADVLWKDHDDRLRQAALVTACRVAPDSPHTFDMLDAALEDPESLVRDNALRAWTESSAAHPDRAWRALGRLLHDTDPDIRKRTVQTLSRSSRVTCAGETGPFHPDSLRMVLLRSSYDAEGTVREAALRALCDRSLVTTALRDRFEEGLSDPVVDVRCASVLGLGMVGRSGGDVQSLLEAARADSARQVRWAVDRALEALHP